MGETAKKDTAVAGKQKAPHKPRNFKLPGGVWRYSKSTMYSRKQMYKLKKAATPKVKATKKPKFTIKPIGGEKNGGTRVVKRKKEVSSTTFIPYF